MQSCCIFWVYFFKKYFFEEKLSQPEKNAYSTSETKWKCIITHVLTNLKTCNEVTIKHPEVFNCVLHHLV